MFRAAWLRALPWLHGPWLMIAWGAQVRRVSPPDAEGQGRSTAAMAATGAFFLVVLGCCSVVGLVGGAAAFGAAADLVNPIWAVD